MALENLTAGVLSVSTIHRVLQEVSQSAIQSERREWEDCFQHGTYPATGQCRASFLYTDLYTEADGVWLHLQRGKNEHGEKCKHYELKIGIAYDGWERLSQAQERYRLANKRVYCHSDGGWCGARPSDSGERSGKQQERPSFDLLESQSDPYARGHLPALVGPHASRYWVTVLRNLTAN